MLLSKTQTTSSRALIFGVTAFLCAASCAALLFFDQKVRNDVRADNAQVTTMYGAIVGTPATSMQDWDTYGGPPRWAGVQDAVRWVRLLPPNFQGVQEASSNASGLWALSSPGQGMTLTLQAQAATVPVHTSSGGKGGDNLVLGSGYHATDLVVMPAFLPGVQIETHDQQTVVHVDGVPGKSVKAWAWLQNAHRDAQGRWIADLRVGAAPNDDVLAAQEALKRFNIANALEAMVSLGAFSAGLAAFGLAWFAVQAHSTAKGQERDDRI